MLNCFASIKESPIPVAVVYKHIYGEWFDGQSDLIKAWLQSTNFKPSSGSSIVLPAENGEIAKVLCVADDNADFWSVGSLALTLPEGDYAFESDLPDEFAMAWGLGAYQFTHYKKAGRPPAKLYISDEQRDHVHNMVESITLVRDLINTPTDDLGPSELAAAVNDLATDFDASFKQIVGKDLLKQNYPAIYTVGRASDDEPRLLDLRWGDAANPKVTLVGKGVCFDTGGLDLKPAAYMTLMKKDMGGSAHVIGLARMIMQANLPICLRVLIPAVENAVSGNAYRPGDVVKSRKGLTIEVGNTDAEGRVVLADALTEAASESPELIIDMATLTGAARVAVGTDLAAMFSNNDDIAKSVIEAGIKKNDPVWRLPLFAEYKELINSQIADINNNASEPYAGAITAALFLQAFLPEEQDWLHFDIMAWNTRAKPGRPVGGEAMALRTLFKYLSDRFA